MTHPKALLDRHNLAPKKSLGQNFLFDEGILARIVAAAEVTPADAVLEIGPGVGSLTRQLAAAAGRVVAVELDDRLLPILREELDGLSNVELVHGDILAQNPSRWFAAAPSYKVVANVPYYITGAILEHLLSHPVKPALMVLTVQKDVAERILAEPPKMSILAVSVQFYGRPRLAFTLPAGAFWPAPKVDSAVLLIDCRERPAAAAAVADENRFFQLVNTGFSQKRKQLHNNLRGLGLSKAELATWLAAAAVDGRRRAETLSVEEWVRLYAASPSRPL